VAVVSRLHLRAALVELSLGILKLALQSNYCGRLPLLGGLRTEEQEEEKELHARDKTRTGGCEQQLQRVIGTL
jgi:hypothetical protein